MGKIHLWDISAIIAQVCFKYPSIVFEGNHFFHSDITCLSSVSQLSLKCLSIKRCSVFEHFLKHQWHGHQLSLTCLSTGCRSDGRRSATFARPSVSSKQTSITDCFNFRSSCFDLDSVQVSVFGLVRFDLESLESIGFGLIWIEVSSEMEWLESIWLLLVWSVGPCSTCVPLYHESGLDWLHLPSLKMMRPIWEFGLGYELTQADWKLQIMGSLICWCWSWRSLAALSTNINAQSCRSHLQLIGCHCVTCHMMDLHVTPAFMMQSWQFKSPKVPTSFTSLIDWSSTWPQHHSLTSQNKEYNLSKLHTSSFLTSVWMPSSLTSRKLVKANPQFKGVEKLSQCLGIIIHYLLVGFIGVVLPGVCHALLLHMWMMLVPQISGQHNMPLGFEFWEILLLHCFESCLFDLCCELWVCLHRCTHARTSQLLHSGSVLDPRCASWQGSSLLAARFQSKTLCTFTRLKWFASSDCPAYCFADAISSYSYVSFISAVPHCLSESLITWV